MAVAEEGRGAAALAIRCIQAIADKDVAQLRELFADDGKWELAYGLDGLSDAERPSTAATRWRGFTEASTRSSPM